MNPCPEYEIQILEYTELAEPDRTSLDAHVAGCAGCTQFLAALAEVDSALSNAFPAGSELPPDLTARVLRGAERPPIKPTLWPEIFDTIGWASLFAALFIVAALGAPGGLQEIAVWAAFGLVVVTGSAWFVLQGWREFGRE